MRVRMSILLLGGSRVVTAIADPSCRVEALVGRASVAQAALGTSHSLFLDGSGAVWSCGENKEVGTTSICANLPGYLEPHQPVPEVEAGQTSPCSASAAGAPEEPSCPL